MLIQSRSELASWLDGVGPDRPLAIDTEFIGERTFRPRLCLVQVAHGDRIAAIDPLSDIDFAPLAEVWASDEVPKLVHAGQQDARILHDRFGAPPRAVVDTQIAASLLGYGESVGLGKLVERITGAVLGKGETLTDWSQRPLSEAQVRYALDDVRYLEAVYDRLMGELRDRDREGWLDEEHAVYRDAAFYEPDPDSAYLRVKGAKRLRGRELAALRVLASWREETAARVDRPRNRVLSNELLVALSRRLPRSRGDLRRLRGIHARFVDEFGEELTDVFEEIRRLPREAYPPPIEAIEGESGDSSLVDLLDIVLKSRAEDLSISPGVVATRRGLLALVDASRRGAVEPGDDVPVLRGWRRELFGTDLLNVLNGAVSVSVDRDTGRVQIVDTDGRRPS